MFIIRVRVIIGCMIFLGYFLIYFVRYNLSVHIVDLVQLIKSDDDVTYNESSVKVLRVQKQGPRYKNEAFVMEVLYWSDMNMAKLFSAYHIGYCICFPIFHNWGDSVPMVRVPNVLIFFAPVKSYLNGLILGHHKIIPGAGVWALGACEIIGPTWVVGIGGLTSGITSLLTPSAAYYSFWSVFVLRIIKGFCAGAMLPSMVQVLRDWVPPIERNYFMWAYCGITTGTFCTFLLCAAVHYYSYWPVGFYIVGACQLTWSALWVTIVTDSPQRHPYISNEELTYLKNTIGTIFPIKLANARTPWISILKSVPFWALCTLNFGYAWIIIALSLYGPFYYSKVVGYHLSHAAALTAIPFGLRFVLGSIVIHTYHWYRHNTELKRIKHIRKYFVVVSHVLPGLLISITWLLPIVPGPVLLSLALTLTAAGMDITLDLCYELTPMFVNSINTVIKIIGNTSGIIISLGVGGVTVRYKDSLHTWKHIWCFHGLVLLITGVVFLIWGETQIQPWNSLSRGSRVRPHQRAQPKISIMSNIMEVDERDSKNKLQSSQSSKLKLKFKTSQT